MPSPGFAHLARTFQLHALGDVGPLNVGAPDYAKVAHREEWDRKMRTKRWEVADTGGRLLKGLSRGGSYITA
jgi:hypothetical protein